MKGCTLSNPGALSCPEKWRARRSLQFSRGPTSTPSAKPSWTQADKHSNAGMLRERYKYYCERVVKGFYKEHFLRFDRQIVLVDCLQPLNSGPQAF